MSALIPAMRARLPWLGVALVVLAVLVGCTTESGGYNTTSPPKMRFVNAAMDLGAVDINIGTIPTLTAVGFETAVPYRNAPIGEQAVTLLASGTTTTLVSTPVTFDNGQRYTHIVYGRPSAPHALVVVDNADLPGGGKYKLRFVNTATESASLDIYVTTPGVALDTVNPTIANVTLGAASDYVELDVAPIEIRIVPSGTKTVYYDSGQIALSERNAYSLVAYNRGDPVQVNAALLTNDTLGSGSLQNSAVGKVRVINAVPGVAAINLSVDDAAIVTNVAYGAATAYGVTASGAHAVTIQPTAAPSVNIVSGSATFPPGGDATVIVFGATPTPLAITLSDANFLPMTAGNARVRVVNAGTGLGSVNTYINGALTVGALVSGAASLYFELPAAAYDLTFVDATSSGTVLDIPALALAAGHTYTVVLIGTPTAPAYVLTQDR
jgi:hypothetical protein